MKKLLFIITLCLCAVNAQIKTKTADVFEELESGKLTLRFFNAVNGNPIAGAAVSVEKIGEYITDDEGKVTFPPPEEDGILRVNFRSEKYIPTEIPVEVMAGTLFFNHHSISPRLDMASVRIVVDWDKQPWDLDAHFVKSGAGGYHISYRNMKVLEDGSGRLDIDALRGYGPETITVSNVSMASRYEYYVHDYSNKNEENSQGLSRSKATVKVYSEGKLQKIFQVPRKKEGTVWKVFTIEQGEIRELGQLESK